MSGELAVDVCVVGAGAAGLSVAAGAVQMGARTVLVERSLMGGECLNEGCVPSKALIAAARRAVAARATGAFGIRTGPVEVDFARVHNHVQQAIGAIAPQDSAERFAGLGVTVIRDQARFLDHRRLAAGGQVIRARRFVLATGSRAALPDIPGLDGTPHLTNHTLFGRRQRPEHLAIIGGGPMGVEMAQAFIRLGSRVTLLQRRTLLPREDPELVAVIRDRLARDGVAIHESVRIGAVAPSFSGVSITFAEGGAPVIATDLLVAAGRQPVTDGLDLERAGVVVTARGIAVDHRLRTANRRIYALGDALGGPQFTHLAAYQAGIVLRNALFRLPARARPAALPRATYTAPELAQVGLTEAEALEQGLSVRVLRWSMADNDRATIEREPDGLVKVVVGRRGRILGAGIAAANAGELIQPWALALTERLGIGSMARVILPYPTMGEASKRAAGAYYTPTLFGPGTRRLVRLLARLG